MCSAKITPTRFGTTRVALKMFMIENLLVLLGFFVCCDNEVFSWSFACSRVLMSLGLAWDTESSGGMRHFALIGGEIPREACCQILRRSSVFHISSLMPTFSQKFDTEVHVSPIFTVYVCWQQSTPCCFGKFTAANTQRISLPQHKSSLLHFMFEYPLDNFCQGTGLLLCPTPLLVKPIQISTTIADVVAVSRRRRNTAGFKTLKARKLRSDSRTSNNMPSGATHDTSDKCVRVCMCARACDCVCGHVCVCRVCTDL